MFSIAQARLKYKDLATNPLIIDNIIAMEIVLNRLHNSIFHYTLSLGQDTARLFNNDYPFECANLSFNFIKYPLTADSIEEVIKSFNNVNNDFSFRIHGAIKQNDRYLEALVNIGDQDGNSISDYRMIFAGEKFSKASPKRRWINLPTFKKKVYLYVETKEMVLTREIETALYSLFIDKTDIQRIMYYSSLNLNTLELKSFIDKLSKKTGYKNSLDMLSYLNEDLKKQGYDNIFGTVINKLK